MGYVSCEKLIGTLEIENSGHQIFKDLKGEFSEDWSTLIKNLAIIADYYQIEDLILAFLQYINTSKVFEETKDICFKTKIIEYQKSFGKILKLFERIEAKGIYEMPISVSYGIEDWIVTWSEYDSYSFLPKLKKWFTIDFNKLVSIQNDTEVSYDTAVGIIENISSWKNEIKLLKMIEELRFNVVEENKTYTSLELYFDVLSKCDYLDGDFINSMEIFISSISITTLKKAVKKYWEKYKYDSNANLYYSSSGDEIPYESALMFGINPDSISFCRNSMLEILHEYNLNIVLPKYISCQV